MRHGTTLYTAQPLYIVECMTKIAPEAVTPWRVLRRRGSTLARVSDSLVVEEPLEIRLEGRRFTATMRTPGHDELLARGLLFTEGVIKANDEIESIAQSTPCRERTSELINVVDVTLFESREIPLHLWERSLISNSSCGLCGKASIEAMTARVSTLPAHAPFSSATLLQLPELMRQRQTLFAQTGGSHAAGIFNRAGECLALFEDIGRHNATDKAIGFGLEAGWLPWNSPDEPAALLVSGRASFEIVQKALVARLPVVCAVSAASSLAVELAAAQNQTLIGFLREESFSIYCGSERIVESTP